MDIEYDEPMIKVEIDGHLYYLEEFERVNTSTIKRGKYRLIVILDPMEVDSSGDSY